MAVSVSFKIHDEQALAGLRSCRRNIHQDVKETMFDATKAVSLPAVRAVGVPSRNRHMFVAKATARGARITTQGSRRETSIIGLLEYGGTVSAQIVPVTKQALFFGGDHPVARVTAPRHYKGKHLMEKAVRATLPRYSAHVERQLTKIMNGRLTGAATFS